MEVSVAGRVAYVLPTGHVLGNRHFLEIAELLPSSHFTHLALSSTPANACIIVAYNVGGLSMSRTGQQKSSLKLEAVMTSEKIDKLEIMCTRERKKRESGGRITQKLIRHSVHYRWKRLSLFCGETLRVQSQAHGDIRFDCEWGHVICWR